MQKESKERKQEHKIRCTHTKKATNWMLSKYASHGKWATCENTRKRKTDRQKKNKIKQQKGKNLKTQTNNKKKKPLAKGLY